MQTKDRWLVISNVLSVLTIILSIYTIYYAHKALALSSPTTIVRSKAILPSESNLTYSMIIEDCSGKDIYNASFCVRDAIRPVYKYNHTDDNIILSFDELLSLGGDCRDWSLLYYDIGKDLGFNTAFLSIHVDNESNHAFTVYSNSDGWCVLDSINAVCFPFLNNSGTR